MKGLAAVADVEEARVRIGDVCRNEFEEAQRRRRLARAPDLAA
jgi:hypothetical protein